MSIPCLRGQIGHINRKAAAGRITARPRSGCVIRSMHTHKDTENSLIQQYTIDLIRVKSTPRMILSASIASSLNFLQSHLVLQCHCNSQTPTLWSNASHTSGRLQRQQAASAHLITHHHIQTAHQDTQPQSNPSISQQTPLSQCHLRLEYQTPRSWLQALLLANLRPILSLLCADR